MARLARLLPSLMPNEHVLTDLDWTRLTGTTLEGGFQLESILSADQDHAAFKVRVLGDSAANAFANIFPLDPASAEEQAALWQQLRRLKNSNLSVPVGAGQTTIDASTLVFVVQTRADEKLDAILAERPLTPQEAGECLTAIIAALEELHTHGLVHGCLAPEHIFAIGDSIKLSTECVRSAGHRPLLARAAARYKAPESAHENITPESDIWCLGATLVEILTQQPCRNGLAQAEALPAPFNSIARKCLEADPAARPALGQIEALYRGRAITSEPKPMAVAAAAGAGYGSHPAPAPRRANISPTPQARTKPVVGIDNLRTYRSWLYVAGAAALVLLLAIWLWPRHRAQPPAARASTAAPAHPAPAWESRTIPPAEAPKASSQPVPSKPTQAGRSDVWRVVLYTYTRQADAENKAHAINTQHPDLNAEAFSPSGGGPYLVVAGGRLTRDDAARLLQRVRSLGLPRDSYIRNYPQ